MWLLLGALFEFIKSIIAWFTNKAISIGFKYPILLAYIASVAVLSALFYGAIEAALLSLNLVFPSQYLDLVSPFIPSNLHFCFSVVLSVRFILLSLNWSFKFRDKLYKISVDSANVK